MKHGKKYVESAKLVNSTTLYEADQALELAVQTGKAKFDETVEVHVKLGVDNRHADQQVRGAVVLPHGTGKKLRVLVFAKEDKHQAALDAGADDCTVDEEMFEIITDPDMFGEVREALEKAGYEFVEAEIKMIPQSTIELTDEDSLKNMQRLLDMLEDNDDVQNVWHNWDE